MAVGDVVNGFSAANTVLTFQPAAGVEVMISTIIMQGLPGAYSLLTNAAGDIARSDFTTSSTMPFAGLKFFINNTNFLTIPAMGAAWRSGYTGIQIK